MRHCVIEHEFPTIVCKAHEETIGAHIGSDANLWKILLLRLWWPSLLKRPRIGAKFVMFANVQANLKIFTINPYTLSLAQCPFEKWGLDVLGPISPVARHTQANYKLMAIDFVTKWVEL